MPILDLGKLRLAALSVLTRVVWLGSWATEIWGQVWLQSLCIFHDPWITNFVIAWWGKGSRSQNIWKGACINLNQGKRTLPSLFQIHDYWTVWFSERVRELGSQVTLVGRAVIPLFPPGRWYRWGTQLGWFSHGRTGSLQWKQDWSRLYSLLPLAFF